MSTLDTIIKFANLPNRLIYRQLYKLHYYRVVFVNQSQTIGKFRHPGVRRLYLTATSLTTSAHKREFLLLKIGF